MEATGAAHRARSSPRAQRSRSLESRLLRPEWLGPGISFLQEAGHLPLSLDLAVGSEQQTPCDKVKCRFLWAWSPQSKFQAKGTTSEL